MDKFIFSGLRDNIKTINLVNVEKNAAHLVKQNCKPFLAASGDNYAFYGLVHSGDVLRLSMTKYKAPIDIPKYQVTDLNTAFTELGYKVNYRNAFFMSGKKTNALAAGNPYVVFPIGEFDYIWSPRYKDFSKLYHDKSAFELNPERTKDIEDKLFNDILSIQYKDAVEEANKLPHNQKMKEISDIYKEIMGMVQKAMSKFDRDHLSAYHTPRDFRISRDYIKRYYRYNSGMVEAIQSGNEIMLNCKSAYLISHDIVKSTKFKSELL